MQRFRAQLQRCQHHIHALQRRLRQRGAVVALMTLLVLGVLEPLACILHCDVFLPMMAAAQRGHQHNEQAFGSSSAADFLCVFGKTHGDHLPEQHTVSHDATPALATAMRDLVVPLPARQAPSPADCIVCAPQSTPVSPTPMPLHEMVLIVPALLCVVCFRLRKTVMALLHCPQCSDPPMLRPPLSALLPI